MMLPQTEQAGASVVLSTAMNGKADCESASVGFNAIASPASEASLIPRNRLPSQRKI